MTVSSSVVPVTTSAALLVSGVGRSLEQDDSSAMIVNTGAVTVYLGGSNVTTSNGVALAVNATLSVDLLGTDSLYVIAASAGQVSLLRAGF